MKTSFEQLVISAILNDQECHSLIIPELKPEYFRVEQEISVKILSMYRDSKSIDTYTLIAELPKYRDLILKISTLVASSANAPGYLARLKDDYLRSQIKVWFDADLGINDDPYDYLNDKIQKLSDLQASINPDRDLSQYKTGIKDIEKILNRSKVDISQSIEKPPTILSIKQVNPSSVNFVRIFSLGNYSAIIGKAKSRKTFLIGLLTASLLKSSDFDKLIGNLPEDKKGVLYFDTEQGDYDCYNTIRRIERLAGTSKNLKGFSLRRYSPIERCQIIEYAFRLFGNETGFCVIDGIADLANAINDENEATRVSSMLLRLTNVYNCHISTIIHQNKNDNFATGHIGSSIMKKAEVLMSVTKCFDDKEISEVTCDLNRGMDFEPFGIRVNSEGLPEIVPIFKRGTYKPEFKSEPDIKPITNIEIPF